jgi:hypothetical protein
VKPHTVDACPLRKAQYCGICAIYGHSPASCPDATTAAFRTPLYAEQLIPASLLMEYNVTSRTPLSGIVIPEESSKVIMEIPETEEAIRAALVAHGEKPMICQDKGKREKKEITENKKKLQKIADALGKKLVYVKEPGISLMDTVQLKKGGGKKAAGTV